MNGSGGSGVLGGSMGGGMGVITFGPNQVTGIIKK